jgi:succinate dehydrogenase/fumarate reductase flavoprotein subunit
LEGSVESDVLVLGGGSGGCVAAIKAKEADPSLCVTIVEKANIRRSGCIASGMDGLNVVIIPGVNSIEEFINQTTKSLDGIINKKASIKLAKESFSMLRELEQWGIYFPKDRKGRYYQGKKGKFHVTMNSPNIKPILADQVRKRKIEVSQRTMATSLIRQGDRICGCTALDTRTGDFKIFKAKAIILATGGCGRFSLPPSGYLFGTFDCPSNTGDAYSMAYHAGAKLTGFEFVYGGRFRTKDYNSPISQISVKHGGKVLNALGEEVPPGVVGVSEEDMRAEIRKGMSPIFIDLRDIPKKNTEDVKALMYTTERGTLKTFFEGRGVNIGRNLIEISPGDYHLCGGHGGTGIIVNEEAETNLKGLYAIGDSAWVPHQWLTGAFVFGAIAGKNAAHHASTADEYTVEDYNVEMEKARVFAPFNVIDGLEPAMFEYKLRRIVNDYIVSPKNEAKLKIALKWVNRLREEDVCQIKARDAHELGRALEAQSILDCVEMTARASLKRKESRWNLSHFRTDFPERNDKNWLKKVIVRKNLKTGKMTLSIRKPT